MAKVLEAMSTSSVELERRQFLEAMNNSSKELKRRQSVTSVKFSNYICFKDLSQSLNFAAFSKSRKNAAKFNCANAYFIFSPLTES